MAKIIKTGNKSEVATCKHCECIFSYLPHEVFKNRKHYYVECPDCRLWNVIEEKDKIMEDNDNV